MARDIEENRIHFQYSIIQEQDKASKLPFHKKDAFNLLLDEIHQMSKIKKIK